MNVSGEAQWIIKLDIAAYQTKTVLKLCTKIEDLRKNLVFLQTDSKFLHQQFQDCNEMHYLEWFINVLFFLLEDIMLTKSGACHDLHRQAEIIECGWLDRLSLQDEDGIEYPKYSIMCTQYQLRSLLNLNDHLQFTCQNDSDFKTEMQKKLVDLIDQIRTASTLLDKAETEIKTMLDKCPFWVVKSTELPFQCVTIRINLETIVWDKSHFSKHSTFTLEYTRAHLDFIPDKIAGSGLTKRCLGKMQKEQESAFQLSKSAAHVLFRREETRLERQHIRLMSTYASCGDNRSLLVKRKAENVVMPIQPAAVKTDSDEECEFL